MSGVEGGGAVSDRVSIIELEKMAMKGQIPVKEWDLSTLNFYLALTNLYKLYYSKIYTREQAHDIKTNLIEKYKKSEFNEKLLSYHADIRNRYSGILIDVEKSGCPLCKKMVKIFDNR